MRDAIHILRRFLALCTVAAMSVAAGCTTDETADPDEFGELTLRLSTRADGKGTSEGEDPYNENAINRVKIFFYPKDAGPDTPAIFAWSDDAVNKTREVKIRLDVDLCVRIFGEDTAAKAFAVVNLPEEVKIADNATVNEILSTVVTTDFRVEGRMPEFVMRSRAMDEIAFEDDTRKKAYGRLWVMRTAAKIRLALAVDEEITDAEPPRDPDDESALKKWTPLIDGMRVYITNGVRKAHVGGTEFSRETLEAPIDDSGNGYYKISPGGHYSGNEEFFVPGDYETLGRHVVARTGLEPGDEYTHWNDYPLYSYPHSWENTPYEERQTYLVVQVPWKAEDEELYKTFFYQVPVNLRGGTVQDDAGTEWEIEENTIESNMYYLVKLHIGMLGSFNPEDPFELNATYYVVPWQEERIEADITDNRYLVVDQENWTMNNTTELDIPFYTSHETVIARVKFRFWNYNPPKGDYLDDGDSFSVNYDGCPLRRTVTWKLNDAVTSRIFDNSTAASGEQICDFSLDPDQTIIHYSHDMKRWVECNTQGGAVFGNGYWSETNGTTDHLEKSEETNWSKILVEITIIHKDEFDLGHLDNTRYQQTVYITQYPPMYIDASVNQANIDDGKYVFVNNNNTAEYGNATSSYYIWKHITNFSGSQNQNPNMYVIYISQLDESYSEKFQIGDPRLLTVNNNLSDESFGSDYTTETDPANTWYYNADNSRDSKNQASAYGTWDYRNNEADAHPHSRSSITDGVNWRTDTPKMAPDMDGTQRILENYYPTDESDLTAKYVAPILRVASSYGGVPGMLNRVSARRRCAAYQEMGRPAGRWRLPTLSEMQFITNLSIQGRIPTLFTPYHSPGKTGSEPPQPNYHTDGHPWYVYPCYWCAQGAASVEGYDQSKYGEVEIKYKTKNDKDYEPEQTAVRCVYDEWYWKKVDGTEDLCDIKTFHWGDKPKQNPQE